MNITISGRYGNRYSKINEQIYNNKITQLELDFSLKRNWAKKYYIKFYSNANLNFSYSNQMKPISGFNGKILNIKNALGQTFMVDKKMNIVLLAENYVNNIFSSYQNNLSFFELKSNYNINKKWSCGLVFSNITYEKGYSHFINTPLVQSFTHVPLIPRSILIRGGTNF